MPPAGAPYRVGRPGRRVRPAAAFFGHPDWVLWPVGYINDHSRINTATRKDGVCTKSDSGGCQLPGGGGF